MKEEYYGTITTSNTGEKLVLIKDQENSNVFSKNSFAIALHEDSFKKDGSCLFAEGQFVKVKIIKGVGLGNWDKAQVVKAF